MGKTLEFNFKNRDSIWLKGKLELPEGDMKFIAVFAHCFSCSKDFKASRNISKHLAEHGIGVLRFDFTGLGNSEGDFSNTNFSSNVEDLIDAYHCIKDDYFAPQILIGHSLGGAAVLKASTIIENVKAIITIGAPSDTAHVTHLLKSSEAEIMENGFAQVDLAGREFTIKRQFIDDVTEIDLLDSLAQTRKSFLLFHSPFDKTVDISHAGKIYNKLKHPKSFISLDTADHLVTKKEDAHYIAEMIAIWVKRYM